MDEAVGRALEHVQGKAQGDPLAEGIQVTLNFHPDTVVGGMMTIARVACDGIYRAQFETATSNGGMTAFPGGARFTWESRVFANAYDKADASLRPKYGSLNHRSDPVGGSRRFGSCHVRLASHVLERTTFCYPDSHLEPKHFGVARSMDLIGICNVNRLGLDPYLDNYIEAHVHGSLSFACNV